MLNVLLVPDPLSIDWSNVPDYFEPSDFVAFARRCSAPDTVHALHSAHWTNLCYGAATADYAFKENYNLEKVRSL